jgi:hypothetical protein
MFREGGNGVTCKRPFAVLVVGLAVLLLAGCQGDQIERYKVAKEENPRAGSLTQKRGELRLLGAIIPHDKKTWVFKLVGPAKLVGRYKEEFDTFIGSIRFNAQDDSPITWQVPKGWKEAPGAGPANAMVRRFATFYLNLKAPPLELTVFDFPERAGSVLANVNRWLRLDLRLGEVTEADLPKITREIKVDGVPATLVDIGTPRAEQAEPEDKAGDKKAPVRMMVAIIARERRTWFFKFGGSAPAIEDNRADFDRFIQSIRFDDKAGQAISWKLPKGWREERGDGLRYATLHLGPRNHPLDVTVFAFGPKAGSLLANINRWRGQIGLDEINEADLDKVARQIKVNGVPVTIIDMSSAGAGKEDQ